MLTERQTTALLRYINLYPGPVATEKLPFTPQDITLMIRLGLLNGNWTNGEAVEISHHAQISLSDLGKQWLIDRNALLFGQEEGLSQWDIDFAVLLRHPAQEDFLLQFSRMI